jgi:transposase
MPTRIYQVHLTARERGQLLSSLQRGSHPTRSLTRARILLLADDQRTDEEISDNMLVSLATIYRIRKRYVQQGMASALHEKPRPGAPPKVDARLEVQLTALARSQPPAGWDRWTLRLLADKFVELELVDSISQTSIRRVLNKTNSSRG